MEEISSHNRYTVHLHLYITVCLDMGVDPGSYGSYSMSVSKIKEGSCSTVWTMGLPAVGTGSGFGHFLGPTRGVSIDLPVNREVLLLQQ